MPNKSHCWSLLWVLCLPKYSDLREMCKFHRALTCAYKEQHSPKCFPSLLKSNFGYKRDVGSPTESIPSSDIAIGVYLYLEIYVGNHYFECHLFRAIIRDQLRQCTSVCGAESRTQPRTTNFTRYLNAETVIFVIP